MDNPTCFGPGMVADAGFEPATSRMSSGRSHRTELIDQDLDKRVKDGWDPDYESGGNHLSSVQGGGADGTRTRNLHTASVVLSQLSYRPKRGLGFRL